MDVVPMDVILAPLPAARRSKQKRNRFGNGSLKGLDRFAAHRRRHLVPAVIRCGSE